MIKPHWMRAALAWAALLAGCAAGPPAPLTYTYPPALPPVYAPPAALGAVAFRDGDHIELFLPNFRGDTTRRPGRFSFRPLDRRAQVWRGHPYRLPQRADIVARVVRAEESFPDFRTGHRVALLPPGALEVAFPDRPDYGALAGRSIFLVPAGLGTRTTGPSAATRTAWRVPR